MKDELCKLARFIRPITWLTALMFCLLVWGFAGYGVWAAFARPFP